MKPAHVIFLNLLNNIHFSQLQSNGMYHYFQIQIRPSNPSWSTSVQPSQVPQYKIECILLNSTPQAGLNNKTYDLVCWGSEEWSRSILSLILCKQHTGRSIQNSTSTLKVHFARTPAKHCSTKYKCPASTRKRQSIPTKQIELSSRRKRMQWTERDYLPLYIAGNLFTQQCLI